MPTLGGPTGAKVSIRVVENGLIVSNGYSKEWIARDMKEALRLVQVAFDDATENCEKY